ncbi:MAG: tRNA (adenosine(37)-N6)-threonylcarbamoyltransferase complex dimerization subunit type 1 TsaB [Bacteroidales bacterium]|nr:tRNA (adenosine(37)-N6)-threonylcarbamoyltransferase complex dimerization subunit type 1 TsaB [Bacteroidales bacterium]MBO7764763.1 tRNA (adenosine(37)-N6)-threonylcarbamoyltransferase complex dimerization subunit type 1 TsaB [Bacteroidales bacterium]
MEKFLLIETSTDACSVALAEGNRIIASDFIQEFKAHAKRLVPMIEALLQKTDTTLDQCCAVSVSEGPGSYTGLRVGVSSAKGICYGAGIPLLGVSTLDVLAQMGMENITCSNAVIVPMLDARRMEVYCAQYNAKGERISDVKAEILDENSFGVLFQEYDQVIFVGDGSGKFRNCLNESKLEKATIVECRPDARYMLTPTLDMWNKKEFKDIAYFEPFYLKDFVAGVSKKSLI